MARRETDKVFLGRIRIFLSENGQERVSTDNIERGKATVRSFQDITDGVVGTFTCVNSIPTSSFLQYTQAGNFVEMDFPQPEQLRIMGEAKYLKNVVIFWRLLFLLLGLRF